MSKARKANNNILGHIKATSNLGTEACSVVYNGKKELKKPLISSILTLQFQFNFSKRNWTMLWILLKTMEDLENILVDRSMMQKLQNTVSCHTTTHELSHPELTWNTCIFMTIYSAVCTWTFFCGSQYRVTPSMIYKTYFILSLAAGLQSPRYGEITNTIFGQLCSIFLWRSEVDCKEANKPTLHCCPH